MPITSLDKSTVRIVLLEGIPATAVQRLQADGYSNIEVQPKSLSEPGLLKAVRDVDFLGIRSATNLTSSILAQATRLIAIGCFCFETDQVDLDAAQDLGIPVFNAPFSNTRSVAELVLAETILLMRGISYRNAMAHRGSWVTTATGSYEVRGKILGIVGYGRIGAQVGILAEAIGMQVLFFDTEAKLALGNARAVPSLDELLAAADVLTLHVPETPETVDMIGSAQLAKMKPGARLINAAHGRAVDIGALAEALDSKQLSGSAIDVFPEEPKTSKEEFVSPLRGRDNVTLTPHAGGSTEEAQQNIGTGVAEKFIGYYNNGSTWSAVNFPEVLLPEHPGKHRFLHIHRNERGVLSSINKVLSEAKVNIAAEYLQTTYRIGYVVVDFDSSDAEHSQSIHRKLEAVQGTIRVRLLY